MKKLALAAVLLVCSLSAFAQTPLYPSRYTVATLPAASTLKNKVVDVSDAIAPGRCDVGGGTYKTPCISDGTNWVPWGAVATGAGTVTNVTGTAPIASSGGATPAISLNDTAVTPGSYTYGSFTVDAKGRLTSAGSGSAPLLPANNLSDVSSAATSRANLGATTVGSGFFVFPDPGAIRFPRIEADNSVTGRTAAQVLSDIGAQAAGNYLPDCGVNGYVVRLALNTTFCRTLTGTTNRLAITNGAGASGDPVFNIPDAAQLDIAKIVNLTTNGFVKTGSSDGSISVDTTTYVPASRILTAGAGLTGGGDLSADRTFNVGPGAGITINADDVALTTPGTLTVLTTNSSSGNHTHAITASANPGAASSILATDSNGRLIVTRLTATDYLLIDNADANVFMKDTSTGWRVQTSTIITPQPFNSVRSISYTSGLTGFSMNSTPGDAEFNNITIRGEMRASVLKINELSATAGTHGTFYSASTLYADMTTPASVSSGFTFDAKNSDAGGMLFAVGDRIRAKAFVSPSGTIIGDAWFTITTRTNHSTFTTYDATLQDGSTSTTFRAGTALADYGPAGTGNITLSADGTIGASANLTMATHAGSPWSAQTVLFKAGNLKDSYGYVADVYGFAAGDNSAAWVKIDPTNGIRLGFNTTVNVQIDAAGNATFAGALNAATGSFLGSVTATSGAIGGFNIGADYIRDAANSFGLASTVTGGDDVRFWAGDTFANRATSPFRVTEGGSVTMTSGAIDGKLTMSGASSAIAIGSTPPTSASAGTGIWLDRTGMYGLLSNVVQAEFNATTGAITAGAGNVILNASGVSLVEGQANGNLIKWLSGTDVIGQVYTFRNTSPNTSSTHIKSVALAGDTTGFSQMVVSAVNQAATLAPPALYLTHYSTSHGTRPNKKIAVFDVTDGMAIGSISSVTIPDAMLDVRGDGIITGLLKTGSTPVTLTDSAGKILSAALNTVAVANGGTGGTTASAARTNLGLGTAAVKDYEEGTWTPTRNGFTEVLGAGSITNVGSYTKIGRMVIATAIIKPAGGATIAGVVGAGSFISGLPYSAGAPVGTLSLGLASASYSLADFSQDGGCAVRTTNIFVTTAFAATTADVIFTVVYFV